MNNNWQQTGIIAPGGTIFSLAFEPGGRLWLLSGAGIFGQNDNASGWRPLSQGQPLAQVNALACAGRFLFAGGTQGEIVYSSDGGQQWYQGQVTQTEAPITCFAAAPNFAQTGVILAGTDGAGILRSTDGGRNWRLASFGLQDFSVLAVATAPSWERREIVFAAAEHGFYRSPNGGRAWKQVGTGLEGAAVESIAVSPNFAKDRTVLVGTASNGIFRSNDGGKSWQPWGNGLTPATPGELPSVNSLWLSPDFATRPTCVAGTGDGQIFYSADGGEQWQQVAVAAGAVLCLDGPGQQLYAGLHEQGLLHSADGGQTWQEVPGLAARAITRLARGHEQQLFAFGPLEGVWQSVTGSTSWSQLTALAEHSPVFSLAVSPPAAAPSYPPCLLAATAAGLQFSPDEGRSWQNVLPEIEVLSICFSPDFGQDGQVWVGSSAGDLLASVDGGLTWAARPSPKPGQPLVTLATLPGTTPDKEEVRLAAATYAPAQQQLTLWRSIAGGSSWQQWQQVSVNWPVAHLNLAGAKAERVLVCLDRRGWCATATGWERVLETDQPILRLERLANDKGLIALTSTHLLCSPDGLSWSACDNGLAGQFLLDLAVSPVAGDGQVVSVLTNGGLLWQRTF